MSNLVTSAKIPAVKINLSRVAGLVASLETVYITRLAVLVVPMLAEGESSFLMYRTQPIEQPNVLTYQDLQSRYQRGQLPADPTDLWRVADGVLRAWASIAPDDGGCHACEVEVLFEDGERYNGRYDLKRHDSEFETLLSYQLHRLCKLRAGRARPDRLSEAGYKVWLTNLVGPDSQQYYTNLLDRYELGG